MIPWANIQCFEENMVKKQSKLVKKIKKRAASWTEEDVAVKTSLPPHVEGQLRCFLKLCVSQIVWLIPAPPDLTQVRVQWWGEEGEGALFRPIDVKKGERAGKTTARYAIRSGPKQLAAYLTDMGSLVLEVLSGSMAVTVGRTQIEHISLLAPNRPINGFFPVFSADNEKIAEVQVSIVLESLMTSYDSASSAMPTPDHSVDFFDGINDPHPVNPPRVTPTQPTTHVYPTADDPFKSPKNPREKVRDSIQSNATSSSSQPQRSLKKTTRSRSPSPAGKRGQGHRRSSRSPASRNGSRGPSPAPVNLKLDLQANHVDHSYQNPDTYRVDESRSQGTENRVKGINMLINETRQMLGMANRSNDLVNVGQDAHKEPVQRYTSSNTKESDLGHDGGNDLVSVLLERGNKLRDAMIVSTLNTQPASIAETPHGTDSMSLYSPLKSKDGLKQQAALDGEVEQGLSDIEGRTVDLVMGHDVTDSQFKLLKAMNDSEASSLSEEDLHSDLGDPLHDTDILEELFYKNAVDEDSDVAMETIESTSIRRSRSSASLVSLEDAGNKRPPSRNSSCSSFTLDREPVKETDAHRKLPTSKPKSRKKKKARSVSGDRRSRLRKRRGSKSSHGDGSDSDAMSLSRMSDSSRVSFDPALSDAEDASTADTSKLSQPDGLSIQRLTLLGRVHVARVSIESLTFNQDYSLNGGTPVKNKTKSRVRGKPPTPRSGRRNQTYFVEYQFPVVATSRDKYQPNAMATEVMRVASKKVTESSVNFNHRSVFPVLFDEDAIEKWWKSALIYKLYTKSPGQKVPKLLGMCSLPLKSVVQSDALYLDKTLEVKDRSKAQTKDSKRKKAPDWPTVGTLKLSIELASDSKDFSRVLAKTRLAEMTNPKIVPIPQAKPGPSFPSGPESRAAGKSPTRTQPGVHAAVTTQTEPQPVNIDRMPLLHPGDPALHTAPPSAPVSQTTVPPSLSVNQTSAPPVENMMEVQESLTLHAILMVPQGQGIYQQGSPSHRHGDKNPSQPLKPLSEWSGRDQATRNVYLVCRMFWCDDITRSNVCWGSHHPEFNFTQVAPMLLTGSLLERMRNNVMVIEVWDKKTSADNDQLVGIVKLPLHQFYMSYRDRKVANSLLKSMYPVVSVDTDVPVVNPFSAAQYGQLSVLLAMGSMQQVSNLQRLKQGKETVSPERPLTSMERQHVYHNGVRSGQDYPAVDNTLEHVFEVCVEGIRGLELLENMIWGEADCFLQYHFPVQSQTPLNTVSSSSNILHATPGMKTFRTATTLCVPDPVFNDVLRHKICLPEGTPVQREILTACAGVGGGSGGIPFEVWCRYYYPNTRDQVIAKALLPLAKLCAMVTMQKRGEQSVQTFSLPLSSIMPPQPAEEGEEEDVEGRRSSVPHQSGLLEVTVNYRSNLIKNQMNTMSSEALSRSLPAATVCISVSVLRAAGLKAAAQAMCRHDAGLQYAAEVGVNSYVRVKLSYLQREDERITRTVARTFAPDFSHHLDFPSPLLWTDPGSDALSLAEILEHAEASFEIWHQVPHTPQDFAHRYVNTGSSEVTGRCLAPLSGDVLLGTTTIPLVDLLKRKTGITGWFPVDLPSAGWEGHPDQSEETYHGNYGLERVIGGLELSIKFAHHDDVERVVHAARSVGWCPDYDIEHRDWESADENDEHHRDVCVSVDLACFPLVNALITGQTRLDKAAHCYVRYKLYDRGSVCSRLRRLAEDEDGKSGYLTCELQHDKKQVIPACSSFKWYLCEERLEIQVWVTYRSQSEREEPGKHHLPNHRDKLIGSAYLDLSALADPRRRSHRISGVYPLFKPGSASLGGACIRAHVTNKPHSGHLDYTDDEEDVDFIQPQPVTSNKETPVEEVSVDLEGTFPIHVSIERALHLPTVQERGKVRTPRCYVSYQTAEKSDLTHTDVFTPSLCPVWNHEHDTRLSKELLLQRSKNLVFKLWHKPDGVSSMPDKSSDKVLGFVSVDLSPLTSGLPQICGWYNIMDFNGLCQGQIKVSLTPLEPLDSQSKVAQSSSPPGQEQAHSYFTSGIYPQFPSHLAWYPEQHIHLHGNKDGKSASELQHFSEHFQNVAKHHQQLRQRMEEMGGADAGSASRSLLFNNLRSNLQELDDITAKMKERLQTPGIHQEPVVSGDEQQSSAAPLSTSSALITCTFNTEQVLGTQDTQQWVQYANQTSSTIPNTDREENQWDDEAGVSTQEGMGWLNSAVGHETHPEYLRITTAIPHPTSDNLMSTHGSTFTQEEVADAMQATLDNFNSRNGSATEESPRTYSFEATQDPPSVRTGSSLSNHLSNASDHISEYDQALKNAQNLLQAIGGQPHIPQDTLENFQKLSLRDHGNETGLMGAGDGENLLQDDDEEENDTFAKHWAMRKPGEEESMMSDVYAEETVVMPRALNDVSNVDFKNMAPPEVLDESLRAAGGVKKTSESASVDKNDTDDTWFTDPNDTRAARRLKAAEHDISSQEGSVTFTLCSKVRLESSDTDKASLGLKQVNNQKLSQSSSSSRCKDMDLLKTEDPSVLPHVSRSSTLNSSKSPRSWSVRKAAEVRLCREMSSSDDEAEERRPISRRSRRSNGSVSSTESTRRLNLGVSQGVDEILAVEECLNESVEEYHEESLPMPLATADGEDDHANDVAIGDDNDDDDDAPQVNDNHQSYSDSESTITEEPLAEPINQISDADKPPPSPLSLSSRTSSKPLSRHSAHESLAQEDASNQDDSLHSFEVNEHRMEFAASSSANADSSQTDGPSHNSSLVQNGHSPYSVRSNDSKQSSRSKSELPNFFLPPKSLEQTMRALRTTALPQVLAKVDSAAGDKTDTTSKCPLIKTKPLSQRLSAKNMPKPSQGEADRIAKIFAQKFSS